MSGSTGIRGYLLQSLIALLDSLLLDNNWDGVSVEPDVTKEKVDIQWNYHDRVKATQVKSSQNQINKSHVISWAKELEDSLKADEYELILIGPTSQSVVEMGFSNSVQIPMPKNLDISGLIEQTAHRLDKYLENKGISKIPPFARELLVNALITKLEIYSTVGSYISRKDFDKLLSDWLLVSYPNSINQAIMMHCDVLCDTFILAVPSGGAHNSFPIILPLSFFNSGTRGCIINWVALKIIGEGKKMLYKPLVLIDLAHFIQNKKKVDAENTLGQFSEFILQSGQSYKADILFLQDEKNVNYPFQNWIPGNYTFQIYIKYNDQEIPLKVKELEVEITDQMTQSYNRGISVLSSLRKINL